MVFETKLGDKHGQSIDNHRVLGILENEKALLAAPRCFYAFTFWCHHRFHWKQCYSTIYLCAFLALRRGKSPQKKVSVVANRIWVSTEPFARYMHLIPSPQRTISLADLTISLGETNPRLIKVLIILFIKDRIESRFLLMDRLWLQTWGCLG